MATIRNQWRDPRELLEALESPAASPLDITPLIVTPIVTDEPIGHLIENDLSLAAATGDPTLRPLADYLAYSTPGGITSAETRAAAAAVTMLASTDAIETAGYLTAGDGGGALYYRTSASTPGGFQSADGAWWALEQGDINVRQYGAVGDGTGDDTAAVRLAVSVLALTTVVSGNTVQSRRLVFPPNVYKITGSLNFQFIGSQAAGGGWEVDMRGATILFAAAGKTLFDCLEARFGTFRGGLIVGDTTSVPAICWQMGDLGVTVGLGNGGELRFIHNSVIGKWSRCAWYLLQSEGNSWISPYVRNVNSTGSCVVIDGVNHLGAITDFQVPAQATDVAASSTHNGFFHPDFRIPTGLGNTSPLIDIWYANNVAIYNGYLAGPGPSIRHNSAGIDGTDNVIDGMYYDLQCELNTSNIRFERTTSGNFVIAGLHLRGYSQASVALLEAGTNVTSMYLYDAEIHSSANYLGALISAPLYFFGGTINGNKINRLNVSGSITLTATTGSLGKRGEINTVALTAAIGAPITWGLPVVNTVPEGWEFTAVDRVGTLTAGNTLTLDGAGTDTINGALTLVLNTAYSAVRLLGDGVSKWTVLSRA